AVPGKRVFDFCPAEIAERASADDMESMRSSQAVQYREEVLPGPDGQPIYYAYTKVPLHDAGGKVTGLVCIGRDATAQRQWERQLAEERNLLRTVINNIPDQIFVKDRNSRFIVVNSATLQILGVKDLSEVVGKTDHDFLPH